MQICRCPRRLLSTRMRRRWLPLMNNQSVFELKIHSKLIVSNNFGRTWILFADRISNNGPHPPKDARDNTEEHFKDALPRGHGSKPLFASSKRVWIKSLTVVLDGGGLMVNLNNARSDAWTKLTLKAKVIDPLFSSKPHSNWIISSLVSKEIILQLARNILSTFFAPERFNVTREHASNRKSLFHEGGLVAKLFYWLILWHFSIRKSLNMYYFMSSVLNTTTVKAALLPKLVTRNKGILSNILLFLVLFHRAERP